MSVVTELDMTSKNLGDEDDMAHAAFDMALSTDEPLVLYRRRGWLRWEATLWTSERVETVQATYIYARLRRTALGLTRAGARRLLLG